MFCGLEECTKIRKKRKKKEINLIAAKSGIGWDERVSCDIQPYEMFFAVLKPFLTETAFYA